MSNEKKSYLIVLFIVALAGFLSANYSGLVLPDTTSYIDVAKLGFASQYVSVRPALYPLLIHFASACSEEHRNAIIVIIQVLFFLGAALFMSRMLINAELQTPKSHFVIIAIIIIAFLNPQSLQYNSYILPENICLLFILIIAFLVSQETLSWKSSILLGFVLVIPMLIKPVWMLLIIIPILYNLKKLSNKGALLYSIMIPILIATFLFGIHQWTIQKNQQSGKLVATTMDVNLNLALIRGGYIDGSEGSSLFEYLSARGLVKEIQSRKWTNSQEEFNAFTKIKDSIPWQEREDSKFWKGVISKPANLFSFIILQSKRIVKFYTNSPTGAFTNIKVVDYLYQVFYDKLHKWLVFPLFLIITFRVLFLNLSKTEYVLWLIILISSLVITFFTYQDPHISRMRSAIEPVLLVLIGLEIGRLYYQCFEWIKGKKSKSDKQILVN